MKPALFLAAVVLASPASAGWAPAVEKRLTPAYQHCQKSGDAAHGVTSAMMDCLGVEIDVQDAALNAAYKSAMARQRAAGKTKLRTSERAWIVQRNATCRKAGTDAGGGSAAGLEYAGCTLHETIKRTIWLERYR